MLQGVSEHAASFFEFLHEKKMAKYSQGTADLHVGADTFTFSQAAKKDGIHFQKQRAEESD